MIRKAVEKYRRVREAKKLREQMSKQGYNRRVILNVLWFYDALP